MQRIKKNDTVLVISGKEKGKSGEVIVIDHKHERVLVRGVNIITKHVKPRQKHEKGKIVQEEAYIHLSNVMPVCPETNKPCRVKVALNEQGKRARISSRTNKVF